MNYRALYKIGENDFDVYRATEPRLPGKFPVFLRQENEHTGGLTPLLHRQEAVDQGIVEAAMMGWDPHSVLVVEICDTADAAGIYRKYSAFCLAGRIIPRHLLFSRQWMIKDFDPRDATRRHICQPRSTLPQLSRRPSRRWTRARNHASECP
jgi:hypothetical protein